MLKKIIYDEIGSNIEIDEGDGKPYDFIVRTSLDNLDGERRMIALLDRYKAAGKSYMYVNELVSYEGLMGRTCMRDMRVFGRVDFRWLGVRAQAKGNHHHRGGYLLLGRQRDGAEYNIIGTAKGNIRLRDRLWRREWVIELPAGYTGPRTFRHNDFDLARLGISPREDINYIYQLKAN